MVFSKRRDGREEEGGSAKRGEGKKKTLIERGKDCVKRGEDPARLGLGRFGWAQKRQRREAGQTLWCAVVCCGKCCGKCWDALCGALGCAGVCCGAAGGFSGALGTNSEPAGVSRFGRKMPLTLGRPQ